MTVSNSTSFEFNIGAICKMAYRESSVINANQTPNPAQMGTAIDELQRIVTGGQAKGLFARVVKFEVVPLVVDQDHVDMPASTLDVVGTAMFIPPGGTINGESPIEIMTRDQYQGITNKASKSRPSRYFPLRTADIITCYLWGVPGAAEAGANARFQTHRIRANVRDPNATVDFEQYWVDYLATELAYRVAKAEGMPQDIRNDLRRDADAKFLDVKPMAMQRGTQQFQMAHRTGWSGR